MGNGDTVLTDIIWLVGDDYHYISSCGQYTMTLYKAPGYTHGLWSGKALVGMYSSADEADKIANTIKKLK